MRISINHILNYFTSVYLFIKSNRKAIFTTIIGFVIALSVIAETTFIIDSQRRIIFDYYFGKSEDNLNGDIAIYRHSGNLGEANLSDDFLYYKNIIERAVELAEYKDRYLNRAVVLIALALSFSIISTSLITSIKANNMSNTYYRIGADMKVSTGTRQNNTVKQILCDNITGIKSVSQVIVTSASSDVGFNYFYYEFLFVDPETYYNTSYFNEKLYGISLPLNDLMEKTVIIHQLLC